jgi:hypothetical protein
VENKDAKHHSFGPRAIEVAHWLAPRIYREDTVDLLEQINRKWPELSFREFWGAAVLAEALAVTSNPAGHA